MKYFTLLALLLVSTLSWGQNNQNISNNPSQLLRASDAKFSAFGSMFSVNNPRRPVEGSVYLFDDWENFAEIYTTDNRKLLVDNINLNVKRYTFETKMLRDSIFVFGFNDIDKFVVNNKTYRNYYWDGDNRVYQVLFDSDNFSVIKGFKIKLIEGSPNPMLNRANDKYVLKERYYVKRENSIKPIRLNKGKILKLLSLNKEARKKLLEFVDESNLSFNDENDINKILSYGYQLQS